MNYSTLFDTGTPPPQGALREYVVRQLLSVIMRGKLKADSRLVATELAPPLKVSATPVREAIVELRCLGMVSIRHNKGAYVLEFGREQLVEFYHVRRLFECESAQLSCGKVSSETIDELCSQMSSLPPQDHASWLEHATAFDFAVHRTLREHCGNQRLNMELARYTVMGETLRELLDSNPLAMLASFPSIAKVLTALEKRCPTTMASAMHEHIGIIAKFAEEMLFDGR